ncbi:hypothetical protein [Camelimonas lactis]|nr:hypothetical protein [Camelimonas lactis]
MAIFTPLHAVRDRTATLDDPTHGDRQKDAGATARSAARRN